MQRASDQILTVAQMVAAEQTLIAAGASVEELMERAGRGAAEWVWRLCGGRAATVLCGPGNNGGDGYVIAEALRDKGCEVRVVAPVEPRTEAARKARGGYGGPVSKEFDGRSGEVFVDCLFGSGLTRPIEDAVAALLARLAGAHRFSVAIDLPSGMDADSGRPLNQGLPSYDLTLALGAWKLAHGLMPGMDAMGALKLAPIGIGPVATAPSWIARPRLSPPPRAGHKYSRGLVLVVEGAMTGAGLLACEGAMRSGAGAVRLSTERLHPVVPPDLILKGEPLAELLADERTGAVLVGPGLGRDEAARERLAAVLSKDRPAVIDADGLVLLRPGDLEGFAAPLILTPHGGEMAGLARALGLVREHKVEQARELAATTGAVIISKGPDTVVAAPDGRVGLLRTSTSWLSVGGSGDVLAGVVAARLAATRDPFAAACEGAWLHAEAGGLAGPAFVASEIAHHLPAALAECL